jgi:hypothetical protein
MLKLSRFPRNVAMHTLTLPFRRSITYKKALKDHHNSKLTSVNTYLLRGLNPQANYTDRATAACRRSYCQLLRIEGAKW